MFERFTDRARRVVVLAQEEARLRGATAVTPDHLVLGLFDEGEGLAWQVLTEFGFTRDGIAATIPGEDGPPPLGHISFTEDAKKSIELSLREALQLGHNYIGTEHILLGLCRSEASKSLSQSVTLHDARLAIVEKLSGEVAGEVSKIPDPPVGRRWFVSYEVTERSIVLAYAGDDQHEISVQEAEALAADLLAAARLAAS
jgi:ATP-dependent Clp protease ATP-binding subunit ClpA